MINQIYIIILVILGSQYLWAESYPSEEDVMVLQEKALTGDTFAINSLFDLYPKSDGAAAEAIDMALGQVAQEYPEIFLQILSKYKHNEGCTNISNLGPKFVDNFGEQKQEIIKRRNSLLSVKNPSLSKLRDSCVEQLDNHLDEVTKIIELNNGDT